jgi:hypothetical protein
MNFKELKKLAAACRKAGIKSYKDSNCEFTLTDEPPVSSYKRRKRDPNTGANGPVIDPNLKVDGSLSPEELLFWSTENVGIDENNESST